MENATKALIIAAAVLIAILIISLGLYIYSKSNSADEASSTMSKMEIMTYNEQYQLYEGIRSGGQTKKLLQMAAQNNEAYYLDEKSTQYCVCIRSNVQEILDKFKDFYQMEIGLNGQRDYGVKYPTNIRKFSDCLEQSKKYKIWFSYNEYGYIWEIHIDDIEK